MPRPRDVRDKSRLHGNKFFETRGFERVALSAISRERHRQGKRWKVRPRFFPPGGAASRRRFPSRSIAFYLPRSFPSSVLWPRLHPLPSLIRPFFSGPVYAGHDSHANSIPFWDLERQCGLLASQLKTPLPLSPAVSVVASFPLFRLAGRHERYRIVVSIDFGFKGTETDSSPRKHDRWRQRTYYEF